MSLVSALVWSAEAEMQTVFEFLDRRGPLAYLALAIAAVVLVELVARTLPRIRRRSP